VFSLLKLVKFYVKYTRTPIFKRFIKRESLRVGYFTVIYDYLYTARRRRTAHISFLIALVAQRLVAHVIVM
jgi:hypothetical protein